MKASTDTRAAAGQVFSLVAADLLFALRALHNAIGNDDNDAALAAVALIAQAGALADDAAAALGAMRQVARDDWDRPPAVQAKLAALSCPA